MDKVLVEISCPAISKKYDFWISKKLSMSQVKQKLIHEICSYEKNDDLFLEADKVILYFKDKKSIVSENGTVEEVGITSGTCILMI